jgi:hypothetical protein
VHQTVALVIARSTSSDFPQVNLLTSLAKNGVRSEVGVGGVGSACDGLCGKGSFEVGAPHTIPQPLGVPTDERYVDPMQEGELSHLQSFQSSPPALQP